MSLEFKIESCGDCPMEHDGYCLHPSNQRKTYEDRARDCDDHLDRPHPLCPLREMPLLLRLKAADAG